ncbi:glycosyltransferase family 4 protein [Zavarzinia compransoris]|uniref:glycosyltransferase family 4 protein n=1 Tax=Zavarzinia marina TaxID=2911065 RepID=UPI001F29B09A|nr:glycosyltransferase family 4 protein [Zavarzinia marina]MCF4167731.1 glycosyltransferase family 4 protein [Zavarzinia marina]
MSDTYTGMGGDATAADDGDGVPPPTLGRVPRVLQVLPALGAGGVERTAVDVAAGLTAAGVETFVASEGGRMVHDLERVGARHITLPLATKNPLRIRANARRLAEAIDAHGIELVHARSRAPAWSARMAARNAGLPFVTTYAGTYNENFPGKRRYNAIMASGDVVIANSHFIAEHVRERYPRAVNRLVTIPRGIDIDLFDPSRVSPERVIAVARNWRLPDGPRVILMPGRLTRWKGQLFLLEALAKLGRRDIVCFIVGDDQGRRKYAREVEETVTRLDLGGVVRIVGHCRDMAAAYMLADVVVAPSLEPEAFGRIPVEGQAMGKPVVVTDHGGFRETVIPGETGLLVPPGDVDALARALGDALALDATARQALAGHARAHVADTWTVARMVRSTIVVYRGLMALR